ncbi:hypothetical protein BDP27DRAFT_1326347 [Rhodocollybia butyracea]|uniref:Uncharacterized protein n=1 Tax=Rhodocollybia butyracea TaxID=206335 RepID=A0A9P5U7I5_9AGAR|nr:hypothetical protein BDP27DRAFT_1326347 [Rhodocollybia butyracea]
MNSGSRRSCCTTTLLLHQSHARARHSTLLCLCRWTAGHLDTTLDSSPSLYPELLLHSDVGESIGVLSE